MINNILVEVCCGSLDDCITAANNNIDRIELNCALELGGLTPSLATLLSAKAYTDIPICCMVRPRTAGFCYSNSLFSLMLEDAYLLLEKGADGIVFGFLNSDNTIDVVRTKLFVDLIHSYGKEAIFHKAFDRCPNLHLASATLIEAQVDRVLTSGGYPAAEILKGALVLKELISIYAQQLTYLPGGGVTSANVSKILKISGAKQIHMTAKADHYDTTAYVAVDDANLKSILANI